MSDIMIITKRDRATVFANTSQGRAWLIANVSDKDKITITREAVEDFVKELEFAEITVDVV